MKYINTFIIVTLIAILSTISPVSADSSVDTDKTLSPYFLVKSDDPEVDQFPLIFTAADVNIIGVIADVTVTQVYKNEGQHALEAIYIFPGSTRAAVYGMTMTIGARTIMAQIRERQKARQEYEQAKQEGKTASLLEQQRPNVFQMNVANILPDDKIKVELKYTELLVPTDGVYEFVYPTVVGPRYSNQPVSAAPETDQWVVNPYYQEGEKPSYIFDISTQLATGMPLQEISCATHSVKVNYAGPGAASVMLDQTEIIEKIRRLQPDHLERLKDALKNLYFGEDFGNLPVFYKTLFQLASDTQQPEIVVERQTVTKFSGDRDYILRYRLAGQQIESGLLLYKGKPTPNPSQEGNEENFFLLMMQPPARVQTEDIPPREYIFIVDVSGSMNGFPLNTSKTLLHNLIEHLRPTDTFNVLMFAGGSTVMSEESVPATSENVQRAIHMIQRERGGGGTELLSALKRALNLPKTEGNSRTIIVVTDGFVNCETQAFELIRSNLHHANLFVFGIGSSVNRHLLEGMARAGQGESFVVTEPKNAPAEAERLRKYIQSPVLTGIEADFGKFDVYDVEPLSIPDILAGRPVILFGKWQGELQGSVTIRGHSGQGIYQQRFDVSQTTPSERNSALRYLWARKRIEILGDYNALHLQDERVKEITNLGLTYNLLTQYTSFLAVDQVVRRTAEPVKTVKQSLPLPQGVSNNAVGRTVRQTTKSGKTTVPLPVATPEPGTILLFGLGLLGLLGLRKKAKK